MNPIKSSRIYINDASWCCFITHSGCAEAWAFNSEMQIYICGWVLDHIHFAMFINFFFSLFLLFYCRFLSTKYSHFEMKIASYKSVKQLKSLSLVSESQGIRSVIPKVIFASPPCKHNNMFHDASMSASSPGNLALISQRSRK